MYDVWYYDIIIAIAIIFIATANLLLITTYFYKYTDA